MNECKNSIILPILLLPGRIQISKPYNDNTRLPES